MKSKTVGTLTLHSDVYRPTVELIFTEKVVGIKSTDRGVEVQLDKYHVSIIAPFISKTLKSKYGDIYYVNKEDAIVEQHYLRLHKLANLKNVMDKKSKEYFEFIDKYFNPKENEKRMENK